MEIEEVLNLHKIIVMNRRGYNPPLKNFHNINLVPGVIENLHKKLVGNLTVEVWKTPANYFVEGKNPR